MGKRTFTITPTHQFSSEPIDLGLVIRNAEAVGYRVKTRGNLGVTAIGGNNSKNINNANSAALSVSFLTSGAATIVGAKSEHEALDIYQDFVGGKN
jgi:adenylyltransferase/sulfurtransferase